MPLRRPTITQITPPADLWIHAGELSPNPNDPTWTGVGKKAPVIMVGCHRNSDEYKFSGFLGANASYDELTIWTRKLRTNKSVDETLYFVGGYSKWKQYDYTQEYRQRHISCDCYRGTGFWATYRQKSVLLKQSDDRLDSASLVPVTEESCSRPLMAKRPNHAT